jgi:hypothetical protein
MRTRLDLTNRTFLIRTAAKSIAELDPLTWKNADYLVAASYMIPVFWIALFDASNMVMREIRDENGTLFQYPVLLEDAHTAVERAARRANALFGVIPKSNRDLYRRFLNYISVTAPSRIYFEGLDLWTMGTPAAYLAMLDRCFAAFVPGASPQTWSALLAQAQISDLARIEPYKLAGSSWTRDLPWKSE